MSPAGVDVVINLVWSVAGLVAGFLGGTVYTMRRTMRNPDGVTLSYVVRALIGLVILLMAVTSTTISLRTSAEQAAAAKAYSRATECQKRFNEAYGATIDNNFDAQRRFLLRFRSPGQVSPEERNAAYDQYFETLQPIPRGLLCPP